MKIFLSILFVLTLNILGGAQNSKEEPPKSDQEDKAKMISLAISGARSMTLPENRALAFARIGSVLWSSDEKQARKLFSDSIAELIAAPNDVGTNKSVIKNHFALLIGQSPRRDILEIIARFDVQLALDSIQPTRPAKLSQYLSDPKSVTNDRISNFLREETDFERRLQVQAAMNDPELASKKLRESIKQRINENTIGLIGQLFKKDAKLAASITDEVFSLLTSSDYSEDSNLAYVAMGFLSAFDQNNGGPSNLPTVSTERFRALVSKLLDHWSTYSHLGSAQFTSAQHITTNYFPERTDRLRKYYDEYRTLTGRQSEARFDEAIKETNSAEDILKSASTFEGNDRTRLQKVAADRAAQNGDVEFGMEILSKAVSEDQLDESLTWFYSNLAEKLTEARRFTEARIYAAKVPGDVSRINSYVKITAALLKENSAENRKTAEAILNEAGETIAVVPESMDDLAVRVLLANGWLGVDLEKPVQLLQPAFFLYDELADASLKLMKFNQVGDFRRNELLISRPLRRFPYGLDKVLIQIAKKEPAKALALVNSASRNEVRVWCLLQIIDENFEERRPISLMTITEMLRFVQ